MIEFRFDQVSPSCIQSWRSRRHCVPCRRAKRFHRKSHRGPESQDADPDIPDEHRYQAVARRPLQKDDLASREVANVDAREKRFSFVRSQAAKELSFTQKPEGGLKRTHNA